MQTSHSPARGLAIEQLLEALPPPLQPQVIALRMAMLLEFADTGSLNDIFRRDFDYPWLSLHTGLLADLPPTTEGVQLEAGLDATMFCTCAALYITENIANPSRAWDHTYRGLQQALTETAVARLAQIFPLDDSTWQPFWEHYYASWATYHVAHQATACPRPQPFSAADLDKAAGRFAPAAIGIAAVAFATGQMAQLPAWLAWHHQLNLVHMLHRDILTIRRDMRQGRYSHPIVCTMQAAGLPLDTAPNPDTLTGAMILTGAITRLIQEGLGRLAHCRALATELNLPAWRTYIETYTPVFQDLLRFFTFPPPPPSTQATPKRNAFASQVDLVARAIERAEKHLLADLTFPESWERQRFFSAQPPAEFFSRAFPMSTILECLCAHGHPLTPQVDAVFHILDTSHYAYYEGLPPLPDCDEHAFLMRLFRFSSQAAEQRASIERGLPWLLANVSPTGEVPIFWLHSTSVPPPDPWPLWGNHCVAITANVLWGLIEYDYGRYQALIEKITGALVERLIQVGFGPLGYYLPPYALWRTFAWLARLQAQPLSAGQHAQIAQLQPVLLARLAREKAEAASPQTAAWLTLACLGHTARPSFDPAWVTTLLKSQRYDGSWEAEPFFLTMHYSGQPFWYSSRLVTTAFCYHALQTYRRYRETGP